MFGWLRSLWEAVGGLSQEEKQARLQGEHKLDLVDRTYGYAYRIRFQFHPIRKYWTLWCLLAPRNPYPAQPAKDHLLKGNQICVTTGREPRTLSRAKALAYLWLRGFSVYIRSGSFPNKAEQINIPD